MNMQVRNTEGKKARLYSFGEVINTSPAPGIPLQNILR